MDYTTIFSTLSDQARLWIYAVDRPLSTPEAEKIQAALDQFIGTWQSHGRKVNAEAAIMYNQFLLIGAEIPEAQISGCGIDASVHAVESIGNQAGFTILPGLSIFYKDSSETVQFTNRSSFRKLVRDAQITGETTVFDPSITHLTQLREGAFELPARSSWHATVFRIPEHTH